MGKLIKITEETKKILDSLKHPGQTYDGVIREIIDELKKAER
jgi:hypothetical protein